MMCSAVSEHTPLEVKNKICLNKNIGENSLNNNFYWVWKVYTIVINLKICG